MVYKAFGRFRNFKKTQKDYDNIFSIIGNSTEEEYKQNRKRLNRIRYLRREFKKANQGTVISRKPDNYNSPGDFDDGNDKQVRENQLKIDRIIRRINPVNDTYQPLEIQGGFKAMGRYGPFLDMVGSLNEDVIKTFTNRELVMHAKNMSALDLDNQLEYVSQLKEKMTGDMKSSDQRMSGFSYTPMITATVNDLGGSIDNIAPGDLPQSRIAESSVNTIANDNPGVIPE